MTADVHQLRSFKLKVYWTMQYLEGSSDGQRSSPTEIAQMMVDNLKIPASAKSVYDVLKISRDVHKDSSGYKLMKSGIDQLPSEDREVGSIFIEANKPFKTKSILLQNVFGGMKGVVKICDPYFDSSTLDFLYRNFSNKVQIQLLTQTVKDVPTGSLKAQIKELEKEGYKIEVKVYLSSELHDRYVMTVEDLWLSANSFNGLGNKESFITKVGSDIKDSVLATFNSRWKSSKALS